jgi:MFS family permease
MISRQIQLAVLQIYLPSLIMALGFGMIVPAIPLLGKTFGVSMGFAAQVVTVQVIGRSVSWIPAGLLLDRIGIRLGMITGALIAVISAIITAFAPAFWIILFAQCFSSFGLNLWMVGRELAAIDLVKVDQRGRQMSALFGIRASGTALGPAIGGVILDTYGFQSIFLIYAGMALVVLIISATIRDARRHSSRPPETVLGFTRLSQINPYFRFTYIILILATFSAMLRTQVLNSMLPIYVVNELGYSATKTGFMFFIIGIVTIGMILPAGFISDKIGRKWATVPPALFAGIAFVAYPLVKEMPELLVLAVMLGIANGMALGSMTTYTYDIVPVHSRAQLQAMRRTIGEMGAFTGPILGGYIANAFSAGISFLFFAPLHLLAAFLLIAAAKESLPRRRNKMVRNKR